VSLPKEAANWGVLYLSSLDNSKIVGSVLMDLSKAYDCLPHYLLIANLAALAIIVYFLFMTICLTGNKELG